MEILENIKLSNYTTIRLGGNARKIYFPKDETDLLDISKLIQHAAAAKAFITLCSPKIGKQISTESFSVTSVNLIDKSFTDDLIFFALTSAFFDLIPNVT